MFRTEVKALKSLHSIAADLRTVQEWLRSPTIAATGYEADWTTGKPQGSGKWSGRIRIRESCTPWGGREEGLWGAQRAQTARQKNWYTANVINGRPPSLGRWGSKRSHVPPPSQWEGELARLTPFPSHRLQPSCVSRLGEGRPSRSRALVAAAAHGHLDERCMVLRTVR